MSSPPPETFTSVKYQNKWKNPYQHATRKCVIQNTQLDRVQYRINLLQFNSKSFCTVISKALINSIGKRICFSWAFCVQ